MLLTVTFSLCHSLPLSLSCSCLSDQPTSDIKHSVYVGGAADGLAPVPTALALRHAGAVSLVGIGVRLGEGGGGAVIANWITRCELPTKVYGLPLLFH